MTTIEQDSKCICTHICTHTTLFPAWSQTFRTLKLLRTALDFKTTVVRDGRAANLSSLGRMKHPLWIQAINQQHRRENHKNSTTMLWLFDFPLERKCILWWVGNLYINQFLQKVWSSNRKQKRTESWGKRHKFHGNHSGQAHGCYKNTLLSCPGSMVVMRGRSAIRDRWERERVTCTSSLCHLEA